VGCALRKSLAGSSNVQIVVSAEGGERPVVTGAVEEPTPWLINSVWPGLRSSLSALNAVSQLVGVRGVRRSS